MVCTHSKLLLVQSLVLWHLGDSGTLAVESTGISMLLNDLQHLGDDLRGVGLELWHGFQAIRILALVVGEHVLVLWELLEVPGGCETKSRQYLGSAID